MAGDRKDGKDRSREIEWYIDFDQDDLDVEALKADMARGGCRRAGPQRTERAPLPSSGTGAAKPQGPSPWVADFLLRQAEIEPNLSRPAPRKSRPAPAEAARNQARTEARRDEASEEGSDAWPDRSEAVAQKAAASSAAAPVARAAPDAEMRARVGVHAGKPQTREGIAGYTRRPAFMIPPPQMRPATWYRPYALGALAATILAVSFAATEQKRSAIRHDPGEPPGPQVVTAEPRQDRKAPKSKQPWLAMATVPATILPPDRLASLIHPEKAVTPVAEPASAANLLSSSQAPRLAMAMETTDTVLPKQPEPPVQPREAAKTIEPSAPAMGVPVETVGEVGHGTTASTALPQRIAETLRPTQAVPTEAGPQQIATVQQPPADTAAHRNPSGTTVATVEQSRSAPDLAKTLQPDRSAWITPAPATTSTIQRPSAQVVAREPNEASDAVGTATATLQPELGDPHDELGGGDPEQRNAASAVSAPAHDDDANRPSSRHASRRVAPALPHIARTRRLPSPPARKPVEETEASPTTANTTRLPRVARVPALVVERERSMCAAPTKPCPKRMAERPAKPSRTLGLRRPHVVSKASAAPKASPSARIAAAPQSRPVSLPTALQPTPF